jgi:hypothetical protein
LTPFWLRLMMASLSRVVAIPQPDSLSCHNCLFSITVDSPGILNGGEDGSRREAVNHDVTAVHQPKGDRAYRKSVAAANAI